MSRILFKHMRDKQQPCGGVTFAALMNEADEVVCYAIAVCHWKDNFVKSVGRAKAQGRLASRTEKFMLSPPMPRVAFFDHFLVDAYATIMMKVESLKAGRPA